MVEVTVTCNDAQERARACDSVERRQASLEGGLDRLAYTTREVGQQLHVSDTTVRDLIRTGALPSFKIGASRRVRHSDLVAFIDRLAAEQESSR